MFIKLVSSAGLDPVLQVTEEVKVSSPEVSRHTADAAGAHHQHVALAQEVLVQQEFLQAQTFQLLAASPLEQVHV